MKDFGYDISDYREVDPIFGHIDDFKRILKRAHQLNLKVIIDEVWSHTSDQHLWFHESRHSRDNTKHDWYVWADPKPDGTPPNNWLFISGAAWTWDARREQYYLHHFLSSQPSLNLWCPAVQHEIFEVAKYWLDMGVDGFRLDVIHSYQHDPELRDNPVRGPMTPFLRICLYPIRCPIKGAFIVCALPYVISYTEKLRAFISQWDNRCLLGEAGGDDSEAVAASYVQTDKRLHMALFFWSFGISYLSP